MRKEDHKTIGFMDSGKQNHSILAILKEPPLEPTEPAPWCGYAYQQNLVSRFLATRGSKSPGGGQGSRQYRTKPLVALDASGQQSLKRLEYRLLYKVEA